MTPPSAFLGILIASSFAFAFHLLRGGRLAKLGLYLLTSWIAFFAGHFVGDWLDWRPWRFGSLNLFPGILATVIGLLAAQVLARPEAGRDNAHTSDELESDD